MFEDNSSLSEEPEYSNLNFTWEQTFEANFNLLDWQVEKYIRQLNLGHIYEVDEIRSEIFLLVKNLIDSGRLKYEITEKGGIFVKLKPNEPEEPIRKFRSWSRKVAFNYLKKLRQEQNNHNKVLKINSYFSDIIQKDCFNDNKIKDVEKTEIREKMMALDDEDCRILEMFYFEDLSYKEISVCLQSEGFGVYNEANLRQKKGRAVEKLRKFFN